MWKNKLLCFGKVISKQESNFFDKAKYSNLNC